MNEILVVAEHRNGLLRDVTFEMLGLARELASERACSVTAALLGNGNEALVSELAGSADTIVHMEDGELADYNGDSYRVALDELLGTRRPHITLIGHTAAGMDFAPSVAVSLGLPLVTDCLRVGFSGDEVCVKRQIYGGKIDEELSLRPADCYLFTLRPASRSAEKGAGEGAAIETVAAPDWNGLRGRKFMGYVESELEDLDIGAADILVSVGRGVAKQENLAQIEKFAEAIGASLSCSRPVADKGWLPKSRQVGTSGKVVRPKLYIALGISGAYQHLAGMQNAETIIAVNMDPSAPIFDVAHYGIVADMFQILPVLRERLS